MAVKAWGMFVPRTANRDLATRCRRGSLFFTCGFRALAAWSSEQSATVGAGHDTTSTRIDFMDLTSYLPLMLARAVACVPETVTFSQDVTQWFAVAKRDPDGATAMLHHIVFHDPLLQHLYVADDGARDPVRRLAFEYAVWLLWRARVRGVEPALREYEELRSASHLGYHAVVVLRHLTLTGAHDLGRGISLVPWDDVPLTGAKEAFTWHRYARANAVNGHAALILHWRQRNVPFGTPAYFANDGGPDVDAAPVLFDALAAMSFATDIAVVPVALYQQQDQNLPCPLGWSPFRARDPHGSAAWSDAHTAATRVVVEELGQLTSHFRRAMLTLSRHLAAAVRASGDPAEACAQLGIALETTFLSETETSELQYRLSTRAARYVGGALLSERQRLRNTVKHFYELRSKAVHRGQLTERQMRRDAHGAIIRETAQIVRSAARKAIAARHFPTWSDFDLLDATDGAPRDDLLRA